MYLKDIQACVDRRIEGRQFERAQARALEMHFGPRTEIAEADLPPGVQPAQLALIIGKLWKPGMTLRVRFLDGDPTVQQRLQPFAHEVVHVLP